MTGKTVTPVVEDPRWDRCDDQAGLQATRGARALLRKGDATQALPLARRGVEACADYVPAHLAYQDAALAIASGVAAEPPATARMRAYYADLQDDGRSPLVPFFQARLHRAARREADCQRLLAEALQRDHRFYYAHLERGLMWWGVKKPAQALRALEAALALRPALAPAWRSLAEVQVALSRPEDAANAYRKYLEFVPEDEGAMRALAELYVYQVDGGLGEAERLLTYLRRAHPDDLDLQMHEAALRWQKGETGRAQELYRAVLQRAPTRARAALNLANLYYEAGRRVQGDARAQSWRRARRAYDYFRSLDGGDDAYDWWDMNLAAPRRLKEIDALLGPRTLRGIPRVSDL